MTEISGDLTETTESTDSEKFIIFSILGKMYSCPSRLIGEIAIFDTVYPLPLMPPYVLGVVNRYSVPYALFDLGLLFHNTPCPRNKMLIFKDEIDRIAFLTEDVADIADIQPEKILSIEGSAESGELTDAVISSFSWNGGDVFVLDVNKILGRVTEDAV
ncbi:MAG: chemotaxis protein CheW [Treponema sp.]|nr:chemotaxis protein CheW [Treponema sp.]